jgi:hypothetical protein
MQLSILRLSL